MTQLDTARLARPSFLNDSDLDGGLTVFQSVRQALDAYEGDDAFCVLYPQAIAAAARQFLTGFPGRVLYAVKANPHPAVLQTLWAAGLRAFDVASIAEIDLVRQVAPDAKMYLMHPVKSRQTIRHAFAAGIRDFAFDSAAELAKLTEETAPMRMAGGLPLRLHLRLALGKGQAKMPLAGKFGAQADDAAALLKAAAATGAELGVTFHVGSQCHEPAEYRRAVGYVRSLVDEAGVTLASLDCGGGFPVAYPGLTPPPLGNYFSAIEDALRCFSFDGIDILGEPGRALCALGGSTLVRVDLRKGDDLYVNDGIYGSLFDAGTFDWVFPVQRHHRIGQGSDDRSTTKLRGFRLMGPTCDSHDILNGPFELPEDIAEGDWIEVGHTGAYGQALASRFNGFGPTAVFAITELSFQGR
jgi:ornithine decarboxylase